MKSLRGVQVGAKVRILQPDYVAGKTGIVLTQEILSTGQPSDRWIVQVEHEDGEHEDIVLSLTPDDFQVIG
ncbi:MAG TPA: hypothetical protein V6C57_08020 [Coleofasciculaceae cyanobacterium]